VTTTKKTLEQWIKYLEDLHSAVREADNKFLRACMEFEDSGIWKTPGRWTSFDRFLKDRKLGEPARYRDFRKTEEKYPGIADKVGPAIAIAVAKIADPVKQQKLIETGDRRFKDEGVFFSREQAEAHRKTLDPPPPRNTKWNDKTDEMARLRQENIKLKQEIWKLRKENVELQEQLDTLQKQAAKKTKEARA
jgi:hypothetical protein